MSILMPQPRHKILGNVEEIEKAKRNQKTEMENYLHMPMLVIQRCHKSLRILEQPKKNEIVPEALLKNGKS